MNAKRTLASKMTEMLLAQAAAPVIVRRERKVQPGDGLKLVVAASPMKLVNKRRRGGK